MQRRSDIKHEEGKIICFVNSSSYICATIYNRMSISNYILLTYSYSVQRTYTVRSHGVCYPNFCRIHSGFQLEKELRNEFQQFSWTNKLHTMNSPFFFLLSSWVLESKEGIFCCGALNPNQTKSPRKMASGFGSGWGKKIDKYIQICSRPKNWQQIQSDQ